MIGRNRGKNLAPDKMALRKKWHQKTQNRKSWYVLLNLTQHIPRLSFLPFAFFPVPFFFECHSFQWHFFCQSTERNWYRVIYLCLIGCFGLSSSVPYTTSTTNAILIRFSVDLLSHCNKKKTDKTTKWGLLIIILIYEFMNCPFKSTSKAICDC